MVSAKRLLFYMIMAQITRSGRKTGRRAAFRYGERRRRKSIIDVFYSLSPEKARRMPTRSVILKLLFTLLAGLGILIALFGLGIDFLLPSSYPGLNLSQLTVIVSGLLLSSLFFAMRSAAVRQRIWETMRGYLWTSLLIAAVTLLALEFVLSIGGAPTYYPTYIPETPLDEALFRACDDTGCHFIQERMDAACARGHLPDPGRYCMINRQGFSDTQDFVAGADFDGRNRILILGDSFTWGMSADLGKSYVETIEANFPEGIVWNAGIPGAATREALSVFQTYAPALQPQIAILGFYKNDFQENVIPVERWIWRRGGAALGRYQLDSGGMDLSPQSPWQHTNYFMPPANEIQRLIGVTRLGSLALKTANIIFGRGCADRGCQLDATREYLRDLRDAAAAQDTALLVLLIPHWEDLTVASWHDQAAAQLMEELNLPYLDPRPILDLSDYVASPDNHWNSAGHQKVGALLNTCIETLQITGDWSGCEQDATP